MVTTYLQDADVTVYQGDALEVLRQLPAESAHMCVTSPPFWNLRDYQVDGQLGHEPTVDAWASAVADVFEEAKRVIRRDGVLIVEIGDSYDDEKELVDQPGHLKNAIRARGWKHRATYIWHKTNAMPESARDRCTVAHSYLLKFVQQRRYFWDSDAIREPAEWARWGDQTVPKHEGTPTASGWVKPKTKAEIGRLATRGPGGNRRDAPKDGFVKGGGWAGGPVPAARNKRSVWAIPTQPLAEPHYAAFPEALVEPCILAGTSERGCCPECGAPWTRIVKRDPISTPTYSEARGYSVNGARDTITRLGDGLRVTTTGWEPSCAHDHEPVPCTVLDVFLGSGTTALVARRLGRRTIGIELSESYCDIAARRLKDPAALNRAALASETSAQLALEEAS